MSKRIHDKFTEWIHKQPLNKKIEKKRKKLIRLNQEEGGKNKFLYNLFLLF